MPLLFITMNRAWLSRHPVTVKIHSCPFFFFLHTSASLVSSHPINRVYLAIESFTILVFGSLGEVTTKTLILSKSVMEESVEKFNKILK